MRKNPSYTALLRLTRLLISEKSATYTIRWSYTIIWQVRVSCFSSKYAAFAYTLTLVKSRPFLILSPGGLLRGPPT